MATVSPTSDHSKASAGPRDRRSWEKSELIIFHEGLTLGRPEDLEWSEVGGTVAMPPYKAHDFHEFLTCSLTPSITSVTFRPGTMASQSL